MKQFSYLLMSGILATALFTNLVAQTEYKYGKIGMDELQMKVYPKDSSAKAVVLYEDAFTDYVYTNGFVLKTDVKCRIKILKAEGADNATVSIPLYRGKTSQEYLSGVEAYAYNLENGKMVKSKLQKENIFEEKVTDNLYTTKLAIPGAKEGSVIEYKYTLNSPYYYDVSDWTFQRSIPVQQSKYEIRIPEYFVYKRATKGFEPIALKEQDINQNLTIFYGGEAQIVHFVSKDYVFTAKDMPALIADDYLWNISDYLSSVHFELSATNFPGEYYKPFNSDWSSIEKTIKDNSDLLSNISKTVPYKEELKQIAGIADETEKMNAVYGLIKSKISWNGDYAFTDNPGSAFKTGTGNNAQINEALISSLNQVGIKAFPVLLRRRSQGRLPFAIPSLDKITTFVVAAELSDSTFHYLDASGKYASVDVLPREMLVDRARTFDPNGGNHFVDLTQSARNLTTTINTATLSGDGALKVNAVSYYKMQPAYNYKEYFASLKDSDEYIEKYETNNNLKIENISINGEKSLISNTVKEVVDYTTQATKRGDFIYLNPLLIPHITKNNFTQSDRKLPVEFNYPYSYQIVSKISIPEGYTVDELPKSTRFTLENKEGSLYYNIQQENNTIQIVYKFQLNEAIFPITSYAILQNFFGMVATKNMEMVVLKKI